MWIDTRECVPLEDGCYLVQTIFGEVTGMDYTHRGGWNTRYLSGSGEYYGDSAIESTYVARWYRAEKPQAIPDEWVTEHLNRKGVTECATE